MQDTCLFCTPLLPIRAVSYNLTVFIISPLAYPRHVSRSFAQTLLIDVMCNLHGSPVCPRICLKKGELHSRTQGSLPLPLTPPYLPPTYLPTYLFSLSLSLSLSGEIQESP